MKRLSVSLSALVLAISLLVLSTTPPTQAQRITSRNVAAALDSGTHPCAGSRVYVVLKSSVTGLPISRPFLVSQVEENQTLTGYLFPVRGDLIPFAPFELIDGRFNEFDPFQPFHYFEKIPHDSGGSFLTWHWANPDSCYSGDPTPFSGR